MRRFLARTFFVFAAMFWCALAALMFWGTPSVPAELHAHYFGRAALDIAFCLFDAWAAFDCMMKFHRLKMPRLNWDEQ